MQKWIGVGRVEGEPETVAFRGKRAVLLNVSCQKSWKPDSPDTIPVLFSGRRVEALAAAKPPKCDGVLVCVIGELTTDARLLRRGEAAGFPVAVMAVSVEFWDGPGIEARRNKRPYKERTFDMGSMED